MSKRNKGEVGRERSERPGFVITVWLDLDAIKAPETIRSKRVVGARMIPVGNGKDSALGFMVPSWGVSGSGVLNKR